MNLPRIAHWLPTIGLVFVVGIASAAEKVTVGLTSLSPSAMPIYVAKEKGNCVVRRFVKAHFRIA